MTDLTETQKQVLSYIHERLQDPGWAPTFREICDHFGWNSTNSAACHLEALERKGYIRTGIGHSRAIAIVKSAVVVGIGSGDCGGEG